MNTPENNTATDTTVTSPVPSPTPVPTQPAAPASPTPVNSPAATIQSPPAVKIIQQVATNPRQELEQLAGEVARRSSRKLLWEYLRLRSRVLTR